MKKLLTFMAALAMAQMAVAIPAKSVVRSAVQPDGTTVEVMLCGDETFHFYTTPDGTPIRRNADGFWVNDSRDVRTLWMERAQRRAEQRAPKAEKMHRMISEMSRSGRVRRASARYSDDGEPSVAQTKKKGLLILASFSDLGFATPTAQIHDIYDRILNSVGTPYGDNHGSVREYFLDQSYGVFDVNFDIKGPVTLSHNMEYYGKDVNDEGEDAHPGEMVKEALEAIKTEVNFADYDWDGDGEVENVYVIYAGYSQASGASTNTIWPHQWALSEATGSNFKYNGITVDTYACGSELFGISGTILDGIGTMCHEYSHCLGLPDFYDTKGNNFGMSVWSIMDYGCYNGDGFCPAGYTAYERWYSGWLEPTELNATTSIEGMKAIETTPEAYIIYNDASHNEYYLLANHQLVGWDEAAYGHGMLVLHVDFDRSAWENNVVNNTSSRQRMTLIPADGKLTNITAGTQSAYNAWIKGLAGDPFPGVKENTELTDESTQKATLYRANTDGTKLMHKPITEISEANGLISFEFMKEAEPEPAVETPTIDEAEIEIHSNRFTATWNSVDGAVSYNLQYRTVTQDEGDDDIEKMQQYVRVAETFESFYDDKDGSQDLSSSLDSYTSSPGWTGSKIYKGEYGAKLGTSRAKGYIVTPSLACQTGNLSLTLGLGYWYNVNGVADNTTVEVVLQSADGETISKQTIEPDDEYYLDMYFDNVPSNARIYIGAANDNKQRFYVDFCLVFDGEYSAEEMSEYVSAVYGSGEDIDEDDDDDWWSDLFATRRRVAKKSRRNANSYGPWQEISNISGTSYFIQDLLLNAMYQYRVQAVDSEGNKSSWSAPTTVQLAGTVGIAREMVNGKLQNGQCYDLVGRRLSTTKHGIYIIDGKKVVK